MAAQNGHVGAMNSLGEIYEKYENYKDAFKCFSAASNMSKLGDYYKDGKGVRKNNHKALECYIQSISNENCSSPLHDFSSIASMYGKLNAEDKRIAFSFIENAAKNGDINAKITFEELGRVGKVPKIKT